VTPNDSSDTSLSSPALETMINTILPVAVGEVNDPALRALLLNFESLGRDCEFGLVQRRYAAEPLGLFRWASTRHQDLLDILDRRFEKFGDRRYTKICAESWGELLPRNSQYGVVIHTFVHKSDVDDLEVFAEKQCKRLRFLAQKLISDLTMAEKVFVCHADFLMTDQLAEHLHSALAKYGPVRFLAVSLSNGENPGGSVKVLHENLFRGFIDHFGKKVKDGKIEWNIDFSAWIKICQRTLELSRK
jgi:hypothetical protein